MLAKPHIVKGQQTWGNQRVFVMCCLGVVVGLSNFWSFPALMTQHGGMAFLVCYLFALVVFAIPLMVMQVALGRHSRKTLLSTLSAFSMGSRISLWKTCAALLLAGAALTVVLYAVVAGMGMSYVFRAALGGFNASTYAGITDGLSHLQQNTERMLIWLTLFVTVVFVISVRGIHHGLGVAIQCFIPLMAVLLVSLIFYSVRLPGADFDYSGMFSFRWDYFSWAGLLAAFKQAFFSLAIGTGVFIVLGTYMPVDGHITRVMGFVALINALVGVLAGIIIIPWLSAAELAIDQGFSLIFYSVPVALSMLPLGQFFGAMLYLLLTLAAWSSAIMLIEPVVAMVEESTGWKRPWASLLVHALVWLSGALLVHSLAVDSVFSSNGVPLFSVVQLIVATMLIPVAGLLMVALLVYLLPSDTLAHSLDMTLQHNIFRIGYFVVRFICFPLLLVVQLAVVFDLMFHSCQFESFQTRALCNMPEDSAFAQAFMGREAETKGEMTIKADLKPKQGPGVSVEERELAP